MQDDDLDFDSPAAWWMDWLEGLPPDKVSRLEAAGAALTQAGCPEGEWKSALMTLQGAVRLPRETCLLYAKRFRKVADLLAELPDEYNWCLDTRLLMHAISWDSTRFESLTPVLPALPDLAATAVLLAGDADFLEQYAAEAKGQQQAGLTEARTACEKAIRSGMGAKRPIPAMQAIALLIGEVMSIPVSTRSLHMAALRRQGKRPKRTTVKVKKAPGRRQMAGGRSEKTSLAVKSALDDGLRLSRKP